MTIDQLREQAMAEQAAWIKATCPTTTNRQLSDYLGGFNHGWVKAVAAIAKQEESK